MTALQTKHDAQAADFPNKTFKKIIIMYICYNRASTYFIS